jgi:predicted RNase H-like HicB family nuclease
MAGDKKMKFHDFEIIIEKEPGDLGYFAYSPSLLGCFSNGATIEETRRNIRVAIQQHITALQDHNQPVPLTPWHEGRQVAVTVPVHSGSDIGRGLAVRILKDAGFTVDDYLAQR